MNKYLIKYTIAHDNVAALRGDSTETIHTCHVYGESDRDAMYSFFQSHPRCFMIGNIIRL